MPFSGDPLAFEACLTALGKLQIADGDEILLADNRLHPSPGRRGAVEVLDASGPASSYYARAVAAARAGGEWLVFVDADCVPDPDLLTRYFEAPPGDRTAVLAGGIEDWVEHDTVVARYVAARRKLDQSTTLAHRFRPYAQTANCAVRREAFQAVGGFPDPVRSGGDADLCWRLAQAGWELEPRPGARVCHRNRARLGALLGQLHRHGSGMEWLERRWPGSFPRPTPRMLAARFKVLVTRPYGWLDFLALWAADLGRLKANGDPTPPRVARSAP